ncbi:hypothetical protein NN561_000518 [Cricetulus griseus]
MQNAAARSQREGRSLAERLVQLRKQRLGAPNAAALFELVGGGSERSGAWSTEEVRLRVPDVEPSVERHRRRRGVRLRDPGVCPEWRGRPGVHALAQNGTQGFWWPRPPSSRSKLLFCCP